MMRTQQAQAPHAVQIYQSGHDCFLTSLQVSVHWCLKGGTRELMKDLRAKVGGFFQAFRVWSAGEAACNKVQGFSVCCAVFKAGVCVALRGCVCDGLSLPLFS